MTPGGMSAGLQKLRTIFYAYCAGVVLFGAVLPFVVASDDADFSLPVAVGIVIVTGIISLVLGAMVPTSLDGSTTQTLAQTYRTRFFLRLAIAEAVVLFGFVLAFLTGSVVPYLVAVPFTAIGFMRAAPTDPNLQKDQDALHATGAMADLRSSLS